MVGFLRYFQCFQGANILWINSVLIECYREVKINGAPRVYVVLHSRIVNTVSETTDMYDVKTITYQSALLFDLE